MKYAFASVVALLIPCTVSGHGMSAGAGWLDGGRGRGVATAHTELAEPDYNASVAVLGQAQQRASIAGEVIDAQTRQPLANVSVIVEGTQLGALTDAAGAFLIASVEAGNYTIVASRIGFGAEQAEVDVPAEGTVRVELALTTSAVDLEEIVVTATGEQRKVEVGNSIATLTPSETAETAPVTSLSELLQARASGLQVIQGTGQTGASSAIRIRGASSLSLTNEPLIIVDGIRYDNSQFEGNFTTLPGLNRMNAIRPGEIESLDVIKGPSAAALYGTAAANGVIVIRTRRGQPGRARWQAYVEGGIVQQPAENQPNYWSWGRNIDPQTGDPVPGNVQCRTFHAAAGICAVDSLTVYDPWTAPETRPFADQPRYAYGLNVSGGSDVLRYFVAANRQDETGPYEMPGSEIERITTERGGPPGARQINPNHLSATNLRANFSAALRPNLTVDVSTAYTDRDLYTAFEGTFFAGLTFQYLTAPGFKTPTNGTQREFVGDVMSIENRLRSQRFTGSVSANWQPLDWLTVRAVTGIDQDNTLSYRQQLNGEGTRVGLSWGPNGQEGGKDFNRSNNLRYSVDLGGTATWNATPDVETRTSVGLQWFKSGLYQAEGRGYGLPVGATSPNSAARRESWEFTTEEATYGAFLEERIGWRDRVYFTVGARTDQSSAFGRDVGNAFYPRASLSYVISDESWFPQSSWVSSLRLRTAYGKAGVQPSTIAALQFLGAAAYPAGSTADEPGLRLAEIGNPDLKPEITTEIEGGVDLGLFDDRVNVEATVFRKRSKDALFERPLPPSYGTSIGAGSPSQWDNLAAVQNAGFELSVDAQIIRTQQLTWSINANGSVVKNKLLDAGDVELSTTPGARNHVGFPLFGLWDRPILGWEDGDGDGVITDDEIEVGDTLEFRGPTLPERQAGFGTTVGLAGDALKISALFDYRGGFYKYWQAEQWRCVSSSNCAAVNDPASSIEDQVAAVAANSSSKRTLWGYLVPNDFIQFRELSVSYRIPEQVIRRFGVSSTTLVLSGRNLGYVWTRYPGTDPEANRRITATGGGNSELTAQGPIRYWLARINVTF